MYIKCEKVINYICKYIDEAKHLTTMSEILKTYNSLSIKNMAMSIHLNLKIRILVKLLVLLSSISSTF